MKIAVWHNMPFCGGFRQVYYHVKGLAARGHCIHVWHPDMPTCARLVRNLECREPDLSSLGLDRLIRGWEERLEGLWETREQSDLRHFVWYGLSEALLRSATKPYAMKAFCPSWLVRLCDESFR
jgi:hypothetical protein